MKITIEIEVDHLDQKFSVGDAITLDELTSAAGSDLDAVVTMLDTLSKEDQSRAIRWVRKQTGAYVLDAKKALVVCGWSIDRAIDALRRQGEA